jgi:hypothetical protein
LQVVIYFNQVGSGNWPLSTSEAATRAFAEVVQSWPAAAAEDQDREPEQGASPEAGPQGPSQTGRARLPGDRDARRMSGIWLGFRQ